MKMKSKIILALISILVITSCKDDSITQSLSGTTNEGSAFGINAGVVNYVATTKDAKIGFVREGIFWSNLEPVNNQYNWSSFDAIVETAYSKGIKVLGYFISTPAWAVRRPGCQSDICAIWDLNEFKQFAKDVAARYKGKMDYIEILNEVTLAEFFEQSPDNNYADWLVAGYRGVKEGNPDAKVLIGGFVNPLDVQGFVDNMLQNYNQYYDIVNFHVYASEDAVTSASRYLKGRMQAFNVDKPIWITETSTKTFDNQTDLQRLAKDVIKRYARSFGEGIAKVFWWPLCQVPLPGESPVGCATSPWVTSLGWDDPRCLGQPQFHPRQAYNTYKLMTSKLDGFSSVIKFNDTQYKFVLNENNVYILWGSGSVPSEISGTVKVTDYIGNEQTRQAEEIVLTESPIFVEK